MSFATQACRRVRSLNATSSRQYSVAKAAQASSKASSSSTTQRVPSHHTLPPAKMRALIALYHQSDSWITEDNLLERIDATFVPDTNDAYALNVMNRRLPSIDDLEKKRVEMRMAPKMAQWSSAATDTVGLSGSGNWSEKTSPREAKVIEALYGVKVQSTTEDRRTEERLLPGLEVVQEVSGLLDRSPSHLNAPPRKEKKGRS
ncbi:hypothetical protein D9613_005565 [Agrocybe pediades]|uniref:Uncharacterized protein n=1 Tax=Agrocybe pediades TaxID=84607 RepID=A0A8H4VQH3_9AGAR|nr:hypothetical protein D9613_005565 [Agrocybe pediades]